MNSDSHDENKKEQEEVESLVFRLIDLRLSRTEASRLDALLAESPAALDHYRDLLDNHEALCAIYPGDVYGAALETQERKTLNRVPPDAARPFLPRVWRRQVLAAFLVAAGLVGYFVGQRRDKPNSQPAVDRSAEIAIGDRPNHEQTIFGHATLRRALDIRWSNNTTQHQEGDVLPAGILEFEAGVAEIDFFCGANLIVEGPAKLVLESDWAVRVENGRLRVHVPPAAQGFVVKTTGSDIVDLGTEFALDVGPKNIRVEVVDGKIELRGGTFDGENLLTGEGRTLLGIDHAHDSLKDLRTVLDFRRLHDTEHREQFAHWKNFSQQLRADQRLIAYYPITDAMTQDKDRDKTQDRDGRFISNVAPTGHGLDGTLVGLVNRAQGRFGPESTGLEFDRPGSRLRVRIDGEFEAFSFVGWVKVDSLDHRYNALFMADGYENGEPHWQIQDDGRLMFSVMIDDTPGSGKGPAPDARLNWVYFTDPVWNASMSGQWIHVAAVYDPAARRVTQFVNGKQVSEEEITQEYFSPTLRLGPAEIGNWGQPFRESPGFAVRNLNGAIDELAIFNAALDAPEIATLYEETKPFGY